MERIIIGFLVVAVIFLGYKIWSLQNQLLLAFSDGRKSATISGFFALW